MVESGQYQRSTGRLPDWYLDQPPSKRGDNVFLSAWGSLGTCRQFTPNGDGWGPIPWDRAVLYARELGYGRRYRGWFTRVILALDSAHREHVREQREQERKRDERERKRDKQERKRDKRRR